MSSDSHKTLRVIQLSDCHLSEQPHTPYRQQDGEENLRSLIGAVIEWRPDLVLATGDLSEDASEASYNRLAVHLEKIGAPVLALPGNHDDPAIMRRYFPQGPWDGPLVSQTGAWQFVLLNSKKPAAIEGQLSMKMAGGLDDVLRAAADTPTVVALHHQPIPVGAHWIDRYPLEEPQTFMNKLTDAPQVKAVVWGHVHQGFEARRDHIRLLGAPSTAANSLPSTMRFTLDERGAACRWLKLSAEGTLETGLLYG